MSGLAEIMGGAVVGTPPDDDPIQSGARDAFAHQKMIKNPYALDDLAITLGRLTPGGKLMDVAGLYPTSTTGPLGPSLMQNISDNNFGGIFNQLAGMWTIPPSNPISGIPELPKRFENFLSTPLKQHP